MDGFELITRIRKRRTRQFLVMQLAERVDPGELVASVATLAPRV